MNYNTIAYQVENGVIVNTSVVDENAPIEKGFIKRDYPLQIGYVEKFGDFYPEDYTQEQFDNDILNLLHRIDTFKSINAQEIAMFQDNIDKLDKEDEYYQVNLEYFNNRIEQLNKYNEYLSNIIVNNPHQVHLISIGSI